MSSSSSQAEGLRVLIVDDEELACRNLRRKLLAAGGVVSAEHTTDPAQAVVRLRDDPPDLVLLDVRMPGLSGFDVLAHFPEPERSFAVVFCTAFDEHAARAFEAAALDYLVKPVDPERLATALARVRRHRAAAPVPDLDRARKAGIAGYLEKVVARFKGGVQIVELSQVQVLSSEAHRTVAYTRDAEHVLDPSLAALEPQLDPTRFARCHRAHVIQLGQVQAVEADETVLAGGRRVPLSRRCRAVVLEGLERAAARREPKPGRGCP
ncbi:MAG: LytTR family DNA-binding domain-containing protein [Myxococcales bacterium]